MRQYRIPDTIPYSLLRRPNWMSMEAVACSQRSKRILANQMRMLKSADMSPPKKERVQAILAGFIGGLAPFAINLAQSLVGNSNLTTSLSIGYVVGMLIFGIMGAAMAFVFGELNLGKAFFLGVSGPAMISLAAKDPSKPVAGLMDSKSAYYASFALVSSAYAQEEPASSTQQSSDRILEIQLNGTMPEAVVAFVDSAGKEPKTITIKLHKYDRVLVPPTATAIVVRYGSSVTNPYPLSATADQPQYVEVTGTGGRKALDIASAFTGQAKVLYDIRIAEPSTAPLPKGQRGWVCIGAKAGGVWRRRYLDFGGDTPPIATIVHARTDLTMRASPSLDGERIGRVRKNESLRLVQFKNIAAGAPPSDTGGDGDYYAEVEVQ